jgi:hypothetical protein
LNGEWRPEEILVLQRINRMNISLQPGMVLAIPSKAPFADDWEDFFPFPQHLAWLKEKAVIFSLSHLAFAAYDAKGNLVRVGPISAGKNCPAAKGQCYTPTGWFRFYQKYGPNAVSSLYPILSYKIVERNGKKVRVPDRRGGAKTPWFMAIVGNIGAHGFEIVPGFNASAGCVRMFFDDAKWLNQHFVNLGTQAIIMTGIPNANLPPPR